MRILKNLFGNNTKIHASNIINGNEDFNYLFGQLAPSGGNRSISNWALDKTPYNQFLFFTVDPSATNLPGGSGWNYGGGLSLNRFDSLFFIILFSTNNQIAFRSYNFSSQNWTSWRVI